MAEYDLDYLCGVSNSYGAGKEIQKVARMASISRAFETDHYIELDESIRICLEKWLRIDGEWSLYIKNC